MAIISNSAKVTAEAMNTIHDNISETIARNMVDYVLGTICTKGETAIRFFPVIQRYDGGTNSFILTQYVEITDIVRCKDCKHYSKLKEDSQFIGWCYERQTHGWKPDDFCNKGESMKGAGE